MDDDYVPNSWIVLDLFFIIIIYFFLFMPNDLYNIAPSAEQQEQ